MKVFCCISCVYLLSSWLCVSLLLRVCVYNEVTWQDFLLIIILIILRYLSFTNHLILQLNDSMSGYTTWYLHPLGTWMCFNIKALMLNYGRERACSFDYTAKKRYDWTCKPRTGLLSGHKRTFIKSISFTF